MNASMQPFPKNGSKFYPELHQKSHFKGAATVYINSLKENHTGMEDSIADIKHHFKMA